MYLPVIISLLDPLVYFLPGLIAFLVARTSKNRTKSWEKWRQAQRISLYLLFPFTFIELRSMIGLIHAVFTDSHVKAWHIALTVETSVCSAVMVVFILRLLAGLKKNRSMTMITTLIFKRLPTRCPVCIYDLTGNPNAITCPECGWEIPATVRQSDDDDDPLGQDV